MRRYTEDKNWIMVDKIRPIMDHVFASFQRGDEPPSIPSIKTEGVRELWWVGSFPFPTPADIMGAIQDYQSWRAGTPDRIILPNLAGAHLFGIEVQYGSNL